MSRLNYVQIRQAKLNIRAEVGKSVPAMRKKKHEHILEMQFFLLSICKCYKVNVWGRLCFTVQIKAVAGWMIQPLSTCTSSLHGFERTECWTAMTSDINYNQEEVSAARNLHIGNIHTPRNLIIKGTFCGGMIALWCKQWEADPNFWERVFMESKGLCLDRSQAGGLVWGPSVRPATHRFFFFSTIKEPLINLTYMPKVHMRRMIPIRLKSNSVQAQLHISSAILLFVFPGRSPTTGFFLWDRYIFCWWR